MRPSNREADQLRPIKITRNYTKHAEGSVLIEFGDTKVITTASIVDGIPRFLKDKRPEQGWLTAEYGMLPRSTHSRINREATRGKQTGRTSEIQRLIGRSLRSIVDLTAMPDKTITIDCDVIQADGGTRTASITGAYVALADAFEHMLKKNLIKENPLRNAIAAVSVGVVNGTPVLDLDYEEDSNAETDMNIVMDNEGRYIEVQGTAEAHPFTQLEFNAMLELATKGINEILALQTEALAQ